MSNLDIIRAWKDEEYRNSLSEEQRDQLPENPAGMIELSNTDMESTDAFLRLTAFANLLELGNKAQPY
ncbi:mersacidin/lichenicidin family type 2 lantibiotic [Coleofasciculus sp. LEGE 07081]|uniref:mersacidin/lichenicidin family type 2 lantibiotic n=1 Tax=Coleofasciculus sp. LEGE 07081 TaxID=2777967 RepID=UPI001D13A20D|nr:mersacidin/lichenicidin family type 2 lantibiotic [Coleofasciculus sp. LEGE 07081]